MIAYLEGTHFSTREKSVILLCNSIGYEVFCTPNTISHVEKTRGKAIGLQIYHVIRENAQELFGFFEEQELAFFELLIGISGIGPKTALTILSTATIETIEEAVEREDASYLSKMGGIGKKNAEKIVLELKGKIPAGGASGNTPRDTERNDVMDALLSLGYAERDIREALKKIPKDILKTGEKIKYALKLLS